jgi:hypothetical protein
MTRLDDSIVHPLSLPSHIDDACSPQVSQMAGDLWLRSLENLNKVADANLVVSHQV